MDVGVDLEVIKDAVAEALVGLARLVLLWLEDFVIRVPRVEGHILVLWTLAARQLLGLLGVGRIER